MTTVINDNLAMDSLAFQTCQAYINALVEKMKAAQLNPLFNGPAASFLTDVNETLDLGIDAAGRKLLDHFLADVTSLGGDVSIYSGNHTQDLSHTHLWQALKARTDIQPPKIIPKPMPSDRFVPAVVFDDDESLRASFAMKGAVAIDPADADLEDFLVAWHDLDKTQKLTLLQPILEFGRAEPVI